jgi:predicted AAA+ superfamily ATPase
MDIKRQIEQAVRSSLQQFPVTALVGPRQVGKTTLAKKICASNAGAVYLDLERPSDLAKMQDAEFYLEEHQNRLICLDEVQRLPEIFPIMRAMIDLDRRPGRFLVLGSASPALLQQSSESLAGRIAYHELAPLSLSEFAGTSYTWKDLMVRGGFPESLLPSSAEASMAWRENFLLTFIERDLGMMGFDCQPPLMRRLWLMLAHMHGQQMNYSKLAQSLDVTHPTVKRYLDILVGTYMVKPLDAYFINVKRRLVKTPKYYIADCGIITALLELSSFDAVYHHPTYGSLWEGLALGQIVEHFKPKQPYGYFRSHNGEEIDLLMYRQGKLCAFEFKASRTPKIDAKVVALLDELEIEQLYIITPDSDQYSLYRERVVVTSLGQTIA